MKHLCKLCKKNNVTTRSACLKCQSVINRKKLFQRGSAYAQINIVNNGAVVWTKERQLSVGERFDLDEMKYTLAIRLPRYDCEHKGQMQIVLKRRLDENEITEQLY